MDDQNPTVTVTHLVRRRATAPTVSGLPDVIEEVFEVDGCRPGWVTFAPNVPRARTSDQPGTKHPEYPEYECVRIVENAQVVENGVPHPRRHRIVAEYERTKAQ